MRLNYLKLENFQGIRDFTLEANGQNVSVFADNGKGKTTLFSAFNWLLTNKDSLNRADFEIKTLDPETGEPYHNLEHSVEAEIEHNGRTFTLKKVYAEKWTKKRDSAHKTFGGHTTTYYIDGVPKPKKDYDAFIASLVDEKVFRILTNPEYFNNDDAMKTKDMPGWRVRRNILLEIGGDLSDEEVIASDKKLEGLTAILKGRKLDDHKSVIKARQSAINKELEKIPIQISEVQRGLPDVEGLSEEKLKKDITSLQELIKEQEQALARLDAGGEAAELKTKLSIIESELLDIRNKHREQIDKDLVVKRKELDEAREKFLDLKGDIREAESKVKLAQGNINRIETTLETLRENWKTVNARSFSFEQEDVCPTCGQALPAEQLKEARTKAEEAFNLKKAEDLATINSDGKQGKEGIAAYQKEIGELNTKIANATIEAEETKKTISLLDADIALLNEQAKQAETNIEYIRKQREKEAVQAQIDGLAESTQTQRTAIVTESDRLTTAKFAMEQNLAKFEQLEKGKKRIKELEEQEKTLATEFEKLEGEMFLVDEFVRTKVGLVEEKINSKFQFVKFKLFETQVNSALNEVCECMVNGVPYSSGLNRAARMNADLDVVQTLSEYYGFEAPVFIDNAEAVVNLLPVKQQVIRLVVSGEDKQLRVEVE